jgi:hypothetical protein
MKHERLAIIKQAKLSYKKAQKNKVRFLDARNELVMQMLNSRVPIWGSFKLNIIKY